MRLIRLGRIALEAEGLRLRHQAKRTAMRVVCGYMAIVMVFGALSFAHLAAWYWLRDSLPRSLVALIFTGADGLLAAILAYCACQSSPTQIEREALAIRRRALDDAEESLTVSALLLRVIEQIVTSKPKR